MEQAKIDRAAETAMPALRPAAVAVVLQSNVSRGVLERMEKGLPAEISKTNEKPAPERNPRGMILTKKHGQKHATEKIQAALEMIRRGENPFRASKKAGIARTTLLYHLEKMPSEEFPSGANPLVERIYQQIDLLLWKTRLRLIKNMFVKSKKADEKISAIMWKYLNDSTVPPLGGGRLPKPLLENATIDDTVTFREFIVERKGKSNGATNVAEENLAEAGVDITAKAEEADLMGETVKEKEG